jgi:hypothetical protein
MEQTTLKLKHRTYCKINTLYKRDEKGKIILGDFSRPEFEYLHNLPWIAYEKIDGTNMSYYWDGHTLEIHGKTENASIPPHLYKKMESLVTKEMMEKVFPLKYDEAGNEIPMLVIIYGEGYGSKIQKGGGRYISNDVNFRVFDINIDNWWLELDDVKDICDKLNLEMAVPYGELTIEEAEKMVIKGFNSTISEDETLIAEGLVLRPKVQLFNKRGERIMVKIKYCDYPHDNC